MRLSLTFWPVEASFSTISRKWLEIPTKNSASLERGDLELSNGVRHAHGEFFLQKNLVIGKEWGAFTSVVVLTASFPSGFRRGRDLNPRPSLQEKLVECNEINHWSTSPGSAASRKSWILISHGSRQVCGRKVASTSCLSHSIHEWFHLKASPP